jgi:hypothetical protein
VTYQVDVTCSTHDALGKGVVELPRVPGGDTWHRILIPDDEVASDQEAVLLAAQMACCGRDSMCTSAVLSGWSDEVA